jgi:Bacterial capsule synthesis protein PGA_cap
MKQLDEAGIVHAGTGKNLEDARAPKFLDTPKGRVALVAMHTPNQPGNPSGASYATGNIGGRPGLNAMNSTTYYNVTAEQLAAIKAIRRAAYTPPPGTAISSGVCRQISLYSSSSPMLKPAGARQAPGVANCDAVPKGGLLRRATKLCVGQREGQVLAGIVTAAYCNDDVLLAIHLIAHRRSTLRSRHIHSSHLLARRLVVRA